MGACLESRTMTPLPTITLRPHCVPAGLRFLHLHRLETEVRAASRFTRPPPPPNTHRYHHQHHDYHYQQHLRTTNAHTHIHIHFFAHASPRPLQDLLYHIFPLTFHEDTTLWESGLGWSCTTSNPQPPLLPHHYVLSCSVCAVVS